MKKPVGRPPVDAGEKKKGLTIPVKVKYHAAAKVALTKVIKEKFDK